ncbi:MULTISPECIES: DNA repair protein RecO [unclassified Sphingobium]|uniref:DNA repair protein RecO n=1 Tax=unclassified Sphingobium TaxID=2611147 RepID=UPI000D15681B|nr:MULTISPECIES: DNA repair protein RecO [unclassified Sphingobium]MBG6116476.1 DNA repair protein RecO (recombination protein O) [Sphingobium sp. JAI105]PSO10784.1 DNA repair protein RecO [Sphingobium sp. AEW4]TWD04358.1 DNA replication and repair protein RecO [Sphingobium sp. AEW010]TWD21973.1 DNA replication and repair protein RecO [Sphingobium sp. AEW013]TWD24511.1 DNA replication and repair protein RecO [Sphingobium sp. AEW001]
MSILATSAIVCSLRQHGEHGAIARLLTPDHGLIAGYVRGGRSRAMRPVLLPGNSVAATFRARTEEQLASLTVELAHSRAPLHAEPLPAAAIDWACALTAIALPEGTPYPALHSALDGVLGAVEAAPAARGWAVALVRYELLLLAELGFGLDLTRCAATGDATDLAFVSPRSAAAVSRAGAVGYESLLLPLPPFLLEGGTGEWSQILDGLRLTGFFLERSILTDWRADVLAARERLVERLKRAVA